ARRRSTARRRPMVSALGESRSCGNVSQLGNWATASPRISRSSRVRSSAAPPPAVTSTTGPDSASVAVSRARAASGATIAASARSAAAAIARRAGSASAASAIVANGTGEPSPTVAAAEDVEVNAQTPSGGGCAARGSVPLAPAGGTTAKSLVLRRLAGRSGQARALFPELDGARVQRGVGLKVQQPVPAQVHQVRGHLLLRRLAHVQPPGRRGRDHAHQRLGVQPGQLPVETALGEVVAQQIFYLTDRLVEQ